MYTVESLTSLTRQELQQLAKTNNIKANVKNSVIIQQLLQLNQKIEKKDVINEEVSRNLSLDDTTTTTITNDTNNFSTFSLDSFSMFMDTSNNNVPIATTKPITVIKQEITTTNTTKTT